MMCCVKFILEEKSEDAPCKTCYMSSLIELSPDRQFGLLTAAQPATNTTWAAVRK